MGPNNLEILEELPRNSVDTNITQDYYHSKLKYHIQVESNFLDKMSLVRKFIDFSYSENIS
jgi:hypothetical protein